MLYEYLSQNTDLAFWQSIVLVVLCLVSAGMELKIASRQKRVFTRVCLYVIANGFLMLALRIVCGFFYKPDLSLMIFLPLFVIIAPFVVLLIDDRRQKSSLRR